MSLDHPSVTRVSSRLSELAVAGQVCALDDSARTALEAASALGIEVGQIASSIVFGLPPADDTAESLALLVITSGAHRVDTSLVADLIGVPKLLRADADFVRRWSGFAIGGVAPVAWIEGPAITLVDEQLSRYDVVWAAGGHPHCVFPTSFNELVRITGGTPAVVGA